MGKNHIKSIVIHADEDQDLCSLSDRINAFHLQVIRQRLHHSQLTAEEKIAVVDTIMNCLRSRERGGWIR